MQDKSHRERLSPLRQQLYELLQQLEKTVQVAFVDTALVKDTVYQISRRCGTPHCRCTRGQLHRNMVLTWSEQGQHRMHSLPAERIADIRQKSQEYARARRARAETARILDHMLTILDEIQELRRETP
jgi:uncharacterized protein DUF6788